MGDGTFLEVRQVWCRYCHQWVDVDDDDTPIEPTREGNVRAWHPECAARIDGGVSP